MRVAVSCHKFANLRQIFQSAWLNPVSAQCPKTLNPCHAKAARWGRGAGVCGCNNICRISMAAHKAKWKKSLKVHTGSIKQKFKARTQQHFNEVRRLVTLDKKSESCGKHFATQHFPSWCLTALSKMTLKNNSNNWVQVSHSLLFSTKGTSWKQSNANVHNWRHGSLLGYNTKND